MSETTRVPVFDRSAQGFVDVDFIHGVSFQQITDAHNAWQPSMQALLQKLKNAGIPKSEWPQHAHWNWPLKAIMAEVEGQRIFGIHHDLQMQGLMILKPKDRSKLDSGECLTYVDYVATAPWNLHCPPIQVGRLKLIGSIFLRAAIQVSDLHGCRGRVGLYALPQAVKWYQDLGMLELPSAILPNGLRYFEMRPEIAQQFTSEE